jgi:hypothetical protein
MLKQYPELSNYIFAADNPIGLIDQNGDGPIKPEPSTENRLKVSKIIKNYGSSLLGLIPNPVGYAIDLAVKSSGSNFGYGAFWRLAHNISPHSYVGAIGITGEGIAANNEYGFFNEALGSGWEREKGTASMQFHNTFQRGTWDFSIHYTSRQNNTIVQEGDNLANGEEHFIERELQNNQSFNLLYEVKTLSPNSPAAVLTSQIEIGYAQAIQNAEMNPSNGSTTTISISLVDKDAYIKAYESNPSYLILYIKNLRQLGVPCI